MLGQKRGEDILEHFAVLHEYYRLSILSNFMFLVRCFFRICPVIVRDILCLSNSCMLQILVNGQLKVYC